MTTHSQEPWKIRQSGIDVYVSNESCSIAKMLNKKVDDAVHIIACVNACTGINPRAVPLLLAACKSMLSTCGSSAEWKGETHSSLRLIEEAIRVAENNQEDQK
jgi:hypothetical protein